MQQPHWVLWSLFINSESAEHQCIYYDVTHQQISRCVQKHDEDSNFGEQIKPEENIFLINKLVINGQ